MWRITALLMLVVLAVPAGAAEHFPASMTPAGQVLQLQGSGERTRMFIKLYRVGLYLEEASADAAEILGAERPMNMRLRVESGMITAEKMQKATREGFEKSTSGKTAALENEIARFMAVYQSGVEEGDVYDFNYVPGKGTQLIKNGETQDVIAGPAFKKALYGIWLGKQPAQKKLKKALLGG
ncbi:chalcone isomerase family protein [Granulosicoccaceae sp. 1_MG-2023]|nr:chalcone isomerase family protein [Granulosicoccaceae sp. 1_MG-2023]